VCCVCYCVLLLCVVVFCVIFLDVFCVWFWFVYCVCLCVRGVCFVCICVSVNVCDLCFFNGIVNLWCVCRLFFYFCERGDCMYCVYILSCIFCWFLWVCVSVFVGRIF